MNGRRWAGALVGVVVGVGGLAGCSDEPDRADALGPGVTCPTGMCGGSVGGGGSGGDSGTPDGDTEDAGADAYEGPTSTITGTIFGMEPPEFEVTQGEKPSLTKPATISVYAFGTRYSAEYDPIDGFELVDVPSIEGDVLVEDIDSGNGILPSMIAAAIAGNPSWAVPVTTRNSLVTIYGSQTPKLVLDEARAHVIINVTTCALMGGLPIQGARVGVPTDSEGVVYHTDSGWVLNAPGGTGSTGVAIIANIMTDEYPGEDITVGITIGDTTHELDFHITAGAVTRTGFAPPC